VSCRLQSYSETAETWRSARRVNALDSQEHPQTLDAKSVRRWSARKSWLPRVGLELLRRGKRCLAGPLTGLPTGPRCNGLSRGPVTPRAGHRLASRDLFEGQTMGGRPNLQKCRFSRYSEIDEPVFSPKNRGQFRCQRTVSIQMSCRTKR
jgi:hypothetical protein